MLMLGAGSSALGQFGQIFFRAPTPSDFCYSPTFAYDTLNSQAYSCNTTTHVWQQLGTGLTNAIQIQTNPFGVGLASIPGHNYVWNTTSNNFILQTKAVKDIRDYGADTTGATDSLPAWTALQSSVATNVGLTTAIPPGTYLIGANQQLKITRNIRIQGGGGNQNFPATIIKLGPGSNIDFQGSLISSDGGDSGFSVMSDLQVLGTKMSCTASTGSSVLTSCNQNPITFLSLSNGDYLSLTGISGSLQRLWVPFDQAIVSSMTANSITLAGSVLPSFSGAVTVMKSGFVATSGTTSNGSSVITAVASPATFEPGDPIEGCGIPYPDFVVARNVGASTLTLFTAATSTGCIGNLTKGPLASVTVHTGSVHINDSSIIDCAGFCYDNNGSVNYSPATISDGNYISYLRVVRSGDALVHFQGADANTATTIGVQGTYGANGCLSDQSFLGNTHIGPQCANSGGYPFFTDNANASSVFINAYIEAGQKNPKYASQTLILAGASQGSGAGGANNGNFLVGDGRLSPSLYVKNNQALASTATCVINTNTLTNVTSIAQWHIGDAINADCLNASTTVTNTDGVSALTISATAKSSGDLTPITQTVTKLLLGQTNSNAVFGLGLSTNNSTETDYLWEYDDPAYRAAGTFEPGYWALRYRGSGKALSLPTDFSTNSDDQVTSPGTTSPVKFANGIRVGSTTSAPAIKVQAATTVPTSGEWQNGSLALSSLNGLWQERGAGKSTTGLADLTLGSTALVNQDANFLGRCAPSDRVSGTGIPTGTILIDQNTLSKAATATNAGVTVACKRIAKAHLATTCDATSGTNTLLNCSTISGWSINDSISGTGIPAGSFISIAPSGSTITISQNATATNSGVSVTAENTAFQKYRASVNGALVTTASASDTLALLGVASTWRCLLTPTNAAAATNIATSYVSAKTTDQITVTHTATASMNYDVVCQEP